MDVTPSEGARVENGWWASSRRQEDANLHVELLRNRNERYSPRVIGLFSIWALVTVGLALLGAPALVVLVASAATAAVLPRLSRTRDSSSRSGVRGTSTAGTDSP